MFPTSEWPWFKCLYSDFKSGKYEALSFIFIFCSGRWGRTSYQLHKMSIFSQIVNKSVWKPDDQDLTYQVNVNPIGFLIAPVYGQLSTIRDNYIVINSYYLITIDPNHFLNNTDSLSFLSSVFHDSIAYFLLLVLSSLILRSCCHCFL